MMVIFSSNYSEEIFCEVQNRHYSENYISDDVEAHLFRTPHF